MIVVFNCDRPIDGRSFQLRPYKYGIYNSYRQLKQITDNLLFNFFYTSSLDVLNYIFMMYCIEV